MNDETAMNENIKELQEDINLLKAEIAERKAALPAHSVKPHQLLVIEELEEELSIKQEILSTLDAAGVKQLK